MKKGFTLIEIIASITILVAVFLVAIPPILNQYKKNQTKIDDLTLKMFYSATDLYIDKYRDSYPNELGNTYCFSLQKLVDEGFLKEPLINSSGKIIDKAMVVKLNVSDVTNPSYSLVESNQCKYIIGKSFATKILDDNGGIDTISAKGSPIFTNTSPRITKYAENNMYSNVNTNFISSDTNLKKVATSYTFNSTTGNYTLDGTIMDSVIYNSGNVGMYTFNNETANSGSVLYRILEVNGTSVTKADYMFKKSLEYSNTDYAGMYKTVDDLGDSYYYRGDVINNNVIFGDFCWKIIRINGDNTVRMIYNGLSSEGKCPVKTGSDAHIGNYGINLFNTYNAYVGYMYGTPNSDTYELEHANINDSNAKIKIDEWYQNNIYNNKDSHNKIADAIYCNDRSLYSGSGTSNVPTVYKSYNRYSTRKPSNLCEQKNDCFTTSINLGNGKLKYPVGLITFDEMIYAGASASKINDKFYLYINAKQWSMTPFSLAANRAQAYGSFLEAYGMTNWWSGYQITNAFAIRPVISLKNNVKVTGSGTSNNPYIVK